ncbi:MAG: MtrB/PioB family outer membrane beta-barrel protein [Ectothiorhodospiraceae bacterium]|nr:MtrB/PioB family outer membrane beta-barrel protein [Ectothiorhodospiraceae bacterium]
MNRIITASVLMALSSTGFAEGNPWLLTPGDVDINISYVNQDADSFYLADKETDIDIVQNTVWLGVKYGISDDLALDFKTGYAKNKFKGASDVSDRTDSTLGLTWRFNDEFISDNNYPSAALRFAIIAAGSYDVGTVNAIGDGASGFETSLLLGRAITDKFAVSGEIGYRNRDNSVPDELLLTVNTFYNVSNQFSVSAGYYYVDSDSNLDIAGPGFSPDKFPIVDEDSETVSLGASFQINDSMYIGLDIAKVIDGRNTSKNDITAINYGYTF